MEHVIPKGENYYPMYSIEWFDKPTQMWGQHDITSKRWQVPFLRFECWMQHRKAAARRVRVL